MQDSSHRVSTRTALPSKMRRHFSRCHVKGGVHTQPESHLSRYLLISLLALRIYDSLVVARKIFHSLYLNYVL